MLPNKSNVANEKRIPHPNGEVIRVGNHWVAVKDGSLLDHFESKAKALAALTGKKPRKPRKAKDAGRFGCDRIT